MESYTRRERLMVGEDDGFLAKEVARIDMQEETVFA